MQQSPPPPPVANGSAAMSAPPATAASSASASAPSGATPRLFFGSLEGALRAQGASAATAMAANAAAAAVPAASAVPAVKAPVSFNNRSALLSVAAAEAPTAAAAAAAKPLSDTVLQGMQSGNINISGVSADTFALSGATQAAKAAQDAYLREMEIAKKARSVVVPTSDNLVRKRLREMGEPITLFGERIPGRRERLSGLLARKAVEEAHAAQVAAGTSTDAMSDAAPAAAAAPAEQKAFLTPGTEELKQCRLSILHYSLARARSRIEAEKAERELDNQDASGVRSAARSARMARLSKLAAFSSEIGDARPLSSLSFSPCSSRLATASWSGLSKVWTITPQTRLGWELKGHQGNVSDIAWSPTTTGSLASCGTDGAVMMWNVPAESGAVSNASGVATTDSMSDVAPSAHVTSSALSALDAATALPPPLIPTLAPSAVLRGHTDRCSRLSFHPSGSWLASTSFDKSWRLWDVAVQREVLAQPGHSEATYAAAFHPDGSLLCTGDLGGIGLIWDLRSGKSVVSLRAHAKQLLAADFHPGGTLLATASDDHTIRIWDMRKQSSALAGGLQRDGGSLYTIGAHSSLISNVRWEPREGLYLLSCSYDATAKLWDGRSFSLVKTLAGHEGKVMRAEIAANGAFIATSAYDRTWKLWAYED